MPQKIVIEGASDDTVIVQGAGLTEEFYAIKGRGRVALSDGTVLRYELGDVWRFDVDVPGTSQVEVEKCTLGDEERYSDRVTVTGDIRWAAHVVGDESLVVAR